MDYPLGHINHHTHHRRRDSDDNNNEIYPPPPPQIYPPPSPSYGGGGPYNPFADPPPPSYVHQSSHESCPGFAYQRPPETNYSPEYQNYPPPAAEPSYAQHTSHENHHSFKPHVPGFIGSYFHHGPENQGPSATPSYDGGPHGPGPNTALDRLANKPTHKIYCKAGGERYVVAVRDDKLVLTYPDQSDLTQHWYKDEKFSTRVKDKEGHPSFMLVNKGTGQAVKHSLSCYPVQLAPYKPDVLDESVLWTESRDLGSGFRTIKTVNNIHLIMDAWNADKDHGGIHDGTVVALYETWKGDNQNQQWKLVRHCKSAYASQRITVNREATGMAVKKDYFINHFIISPSECNAFVFGNNLQ